MIKSDYIVFDVETGGLDETKNPMTQYAAVILDGCTLKEIDRFETFLKPYGGLMIEQKALDGTMVTMADVNRGMDIRTFAKTVTTWWEQHRAKAKIREMGRLIPVGHNVKFDIRFVSAGLIHGGVSESIYEWLYPNFIDTLALAKMTWGLDREQKLNLGSCCERTKIGLKDAHGAMNDVVATAELLRWYSRKLRRTTTDKQLQEITSRPLGEEFFEFKCK